MKSFFACLICCIAGLSVTAQTETYPVVPGCPSSETQDCFVAYVQQQLQAALTSNLETNVTIRFETTPDGAYRPILVTGTETQKEEARAALVALDMTEPAKYGDTPIFMQFELRIGNATNSINALAPSITPQLVKLEPQDTTAARFAIRDNVPLVVTGTPQPYTMREFGSGLRIPLSRKRYQQYARALNQVAGNLHTAVRPFTFLDVDQVYDLQAVYDAQLKDKSGWWGRKWWNEHMVGVYADDYWFTLDPGVDLQVGRDGDTGNTTWNNTRLVSVQGGLGSDFNFAATIYESQGWFAGYFNELARSLRPDGGNPAIIPGRGIAKEFGDEAFDYPVATGYINYRPSKFFNLELGHGKNFIGDGYRSMLLSDNASPYPYFKATTTFWNIQYTNIYTSLRDVRSAVTADGSFRTKYMASHHLSWNVNKKLNIGLFESVIWENDNDRGFDFNYVNPVILYRSIEFSTGSRGGNAIIGLTGKYKWNDRFTLYSQLLIDEFSGSDITGGEGSYKNKIAYQLGAQYYDAFGVQGLNLRGEYNQARPYTYSHNTITLNYGHANQSLAHPWGANFREILGRAVFQRRRWMGEGQLTYGRRGFDVLQDGDTFFYGGNVYRSEDDRPSDNGNSILQGNTADYYYASVQGGYLINPASRLTAYVQLIARGISPQFDNAVVRDQNTVWFNLGLRTDIFDWNWDY